MNVAPTTVIDYIPTSVSPTYYAYNGISYAYYTGYGYYTLPSYYYGYYYNYYNYYYPTHYTSYYSRSYPLVSRWASLRWR
jgi:hypothetical protein